MAMPLRWTAAGLLGAAAALAPGAVAQDAMPPFATPAYPSTRQVPPPPLLQARLQAIAGQFGGRIGISVRDLRDGWTVGHDDQMLCPQQSVSKFWVALTAFEQIDRGRLTLDTPVTITRSDLTLFNQPIAQLVGASGYRTTVGDLIERALTLSDNTANDSLLRTVGGPQVVRDTLARHGIGAVRFGPGERAMQSAIAGMSWRQAFSEGRSFEKARAMVDPSVRRKAFYGYIADPIDGAAPAAITAVLARLEQGAILSPASGQQLLATMSRTKTGRARLKAALEPGWTLAHKTGTGQQLGATVAGFNDIGLLTAPDGRRYAIAVMIAESSRPIAERQGVIQDVARLVIGNWRETVWARRPVPGTSATVY